MSKRLPPSEAPERDTRGDREHTVREIRQIMDAWVEDNDNNILDTEDLLEGNEDDADSDGDFDSYDINGPRYANLYQGDWHAELDRDSLFLWRTHLPRDTILIRYVVPPRVRARLWVEDSTATIVRLLADPARRGAHELFWDRTASNGRSAIAGRPYFVVLDTPSRRLSKRVRWR